MDAENDRCKLYGNNPDFAVRRCANTGFSSYRPAKKFIGCGKCKHLYYECYENEDLEIIFCEKGHQDHVFNTEPCEDFKD